MKKVSVSFVRPLVVELELPDDDPLDPNQLEEAARAMIIENNPSVQQGPLLFDGFEQEE